MEIDSLKNLKYVDMSMLASTLLLPVSLLKLDLNDTSVFTNSIRTSLLIEIS